MSDKKPTLDILKEIVANTKTILQQISKQDENILVGIKDMIVVTGSYRGVIGKALTDMLDSPELVLKSIFNIFTKPHKPQERFQRNFKSKKWQEAPFCYYRQYFENAFYELTTTIENLPGLAQFDKEQTSLFFRIFFEYIAPYNHICFHPDLLSLTKKEKGANLLRGFNNFLKDLTLWHGYYNFTSCPRDKYILGEDLAYTKGHVIYENQLMELISYVPQTEDKKGVPLLIVTSWINKYYIIDLKKNNSLINWLSEQGFHVYTLSWNMPDKSFENLKFNDYIQDGILTAIEQITKHYPQKALHLAGYCLGGTLAATAATIIEKQYSATLLSLSLLTCMVDFTNAGEMKKLLGDAQIEAFENSMRGFGIWNGRKMAAAFNLMDPECSIWLFYQRNYLYGEPPRANDIIFWAQDYTHIPEKLFQFYMRDLYRDNILPSQYNYGDIDCPVYYLGLQQDTITPKQAAFDSSKLFKNARFVLGDGGHLVGLLSTPKQKLLGYYIGDNNNDIDVNDWQQHAEYKKGSWWLDWNDWLQSLSDVQFDYPIDKKKALYTAPGNNIKKTIC